MYLLEKLYTLPFESATVSISYFERCIGALRRFRKTMLADKIEAELQAYVDHRRQMPNAVKRRFLRGSR